ncbi:MAG TPA: hypothetical protein VEI74_15245 [Candidatus Methylomirabilis sp.]|nr:hypothetical protein [Candidatus Methylomirabilis sp.]
MQASTNHRRVAGFGRRIRFVMAATIAAVFLPSAPTLAASVSYFLDQSNRLADGTDYLKVTIDDNGAPGAINFTLQALAPLSGQFCNNFSILKFGFNGNELHKSNIVGLPDHWKFTNDKKMDGFGKFENVLVGKKWTSQDPLTFSIVGIDGDNIYNYATSHDGSDGLFFSAFVGGNEFNKHGTWHDKWRDDGCRRCTKSAYFAGGTAAPVPVPAAAWLFGSGLIGLFGLASRRQSKTT